MKMTKLTAKRTENLMKDARGKARSYSDTYDIRADGTSIGTVSRSSSWKPDRWKRLIRYDHSWEIRLHYKDAKILSDMGRERTSEAVLAQVRRWVEWVDGGCRGIGPLRHSSLYKNIPRFDPGYTGVPATLLIRNRWDEGEPKVGIAETRDYTGSRRNRMVAAVGLSGRVYAGKLPEEVRRSVHEWMVRHRDRITEIWWSRANANEFAQEIVTNNTVREAGPDGKSMKIKPRYFDELRGKCYHPLEQSQRSNQPPPGEEAEVGSVQPEPGPGAS
jgi:hypothetical protein